MAATTGALFGIANAVSIMPGILAQPKGASGVVSVEAFCNNAAASATVQIQGSISGQNWNNVGSPMSCSGTTAQFATTTGINYNMYRANITAISGTGASVQVWMAT